MSAAREKIAIITDSTADLEPATAESCGISVLPLHVVYSEGSYRDGVDITADEISARLEREIPTTSAPSTQEAIDLLDSRAASMAMGFVAVEAARLAAQGKTTCVARV